VEVIGHFAERGPVEGGHASARKNERKIFQDCKVFCCCYLFLFYGSNGIGTQGLTLPGSTKLLKPFCQTKTMKF
jgi:hypothetical protein